jgi:hypothetical protein
VSSYKVSVGNATVRVKTFQEAGAVVVEAVTNLLAEDPEGAAEGAMMANLAFSEGTVQHALDTHRRDPAKSFMRSEAALASAADRGRGGGWQRRC